MSTCSPICGDGLVLGVEVCDDDEDDGLGCATGCLSINPLYECPILGGPFNASLCNKICSNSKLEVGETCDDSNDIDGDGCSQVCVIEEGYECLEVGEAC